MVWPKSSGVVIIYPIGIDLPLCAIRSLSLQMIDGNDRHRLEAFEDS
jgi:hypothetical protein